MNLQKILFLCGLLLLGCHGSSDNHGFSYSRSTAADNLVEHEFRLADTRLNLLAPSELYTRSVSEMSENKVIIALRDKGDEYGVDIVVDFSHGGMALGKFGDNGRYQLLKEKENGSQPHWKLLDK